MQMFALDANPRKSAEFLCDAHVRVICREVAMLLSNWYYWNVPESRPMLPYKPMSVNQPLSRQMDSNFVRRWAFDYSEEIFKEFVYRFNKVHVSYEKFVALKAAREKFDPGMNHGTDCAFGFTIVEKNGGIYPGYPLMKVVELYRNYYWKKLNDMKVPVSYTKRMPPDWLKDFENFFTYQLTNDKTMVY